MRRGSQSSHSGCTSGADHAGESSGRRAPSVEGSPWSTLERPKLEILHVPSRRRMLRLLRSRCATCPASPLCSPLARTRERQFFIDNRLVRIHFIIVMIRWTGLAPWEFKSPLPEQPFLSRAPYLAIERSRAWCTQRVPAAPSSSEEPPAPGSPGKTSQPSTLRSRGRARRMTAECPASWCVPAGIRDRTPVGSGGRTSPQPAVGRSPCALGL